MFGVHNGRLSAAEITRHERIAKKHDSTFVYARLPGEGYRSWFATRNLGEPFNGAIEQAVFEDLRS